MSQVSPATIFVPYIVTSNVTGRHRGLKQKRRAGYRALSSK